AERLNKRGEEVEISAIADPSLGIRLSRGFVRVERLRGPQLIPIAGILVGSLIGFPPATAVHDFEVANMVKKLEENRPQHHAVLHRSEGGLGTTVKAR